MNLRSGFRRPVDHLRFPRGDLPEHINVLLQFTLQCRHPQDKLELECPSLFWLGSMYTCISAFEEGQS